MDRKPKVRIFEGLRFVDIESSHHPLPVSTFYTSPSAFHSSSSNFFAHTFFYNLSKIHFNCKMAPPTKVTKRTVPSSQSRAAMKELSKDDLETIAVVFRNSSIKVS